jgi:AraC-like DNA-binding protein
MQIQFYSPKGFLKNFVEAIVFQHGAGTGVAFQRMHQVIIINLGHRFGVSGLYDAATGTREHSDTVWINGKQDTAFMLENKGIMHMYVICVNAGMLPYLAGLPAIETNDQAVGADNWSSKEIFNLREQLLACGDVQAGFLLIEHYFTQLLMKQDHAELQKINWLYQAIQTKSVNAICGELGVTRKKLRSEAHYYFGGSVKNLQGIIRLNHTLQEIAKNSDRNLSALHDYYDQSHFINDFKARTGITPLQYKRLCQQYPLIKLTPNFLSMERETFLQFIAP